MNFFSVNIHTRRFPIESVPKKEEELENWLQERWAEKEKLIEYFHKNGNFPNVYEEPFVHLDMKLD